MTVFDDSSLDDPDALRGADEVLRRLAEAGARLRRETELAGAGLSAVSDSPRPRAVVAAGTDARLIRAMLEPYCPVPFVAWPTHGLPGWVGALDLVVVLASDGADAGLVATTHEAVRRGSMLLVAAPAGSTIADRAGSRSTVLLPTTTADPLAAAIVVLRALHLLGLGPQVDPERVATAMDEVAEDCSPFLDVSQNPAKDIALCLAEAQPLIWGGSVLAARASRRLAEAIRAASGRAALAADANALLPVIEGAAPVDLFADPFEDASGGDRRPVLVALEDGLGGDLTRAQRNRLLAAADRTEVRVCLVEHRSGADVERYAALLQTGLFASIYLAVGLGRYLAL